MNLNLPCRLLPIVSPRSLIQQLPLGHVPILFCGAMFTSWAMFWLATYAVLGWRWIYMGIWGSWVSGKAAYQHAPAYASGGSDRHPSGQGTRHRVPPREVPLLWSHYVQYRGLSPPERASKPRTVVPKGPHIFLGPWVLSNNSIAVHKPKLQCHIVLHRSLQPRRCPRIMDARLQTPHLPETRQGPTITSTTCNSSTPANDPSRAWDTVPL